MSIFLFGILPEQYRHFINREKTGTWGKNGADIGLMSDFEFFY